MQTSVKRLGGTTAEITVTIPAADVSREIAEAYSRLSSRIRIPGFRPGKAPRQIVDSRLGRESILEDAREQLVEDGYPLALNAEGLRPIASPDFGELADLVDGEDYTFTATVELRPELELASDDPIVVTVPSTKASDREIDAQINFTRERYASLEPVDRGIEKGDFALISFTGQVDGEDYEGNVVEKYLYETDRGLMPQEFDAVLWGVKAGDKAHAEFEIPDTTSNPDFVGKTATFDVDVHEVKAKVLPELDDAFATEVGGYDTYQDLRDDLRRKLEEQKMAGHLHEVERAARAQLAERVAGDIPEAMIEYRANSLSEEFFDTLEARKISLDDYVAATGVGVDQIKADIKERAGSLIREELALEALCRAKGIEVSDDEVAAEVKEMAGSEPGANERMFERLRQAGMLPLVREQIMQRKAVRWLMDNTEVVESEPLSADEVAEAVGETEKPSRKKKTKEADAS